MAWRLGNRLQASWLLASMLSLSTVSTAALPPASLPPPAATRPPVILASGILPSQPLSLNEQGVETLLKAKEAVAEPRAQVGRASWYGPGFHGRKTASGEVFDQNKLSAAHPTITLFSLVRVTNLENGASVVVKITDRGPYKNKRIIDVSRQAAKQLGFLKKGTARVRIVVLRDGTG